MPEAAEVWTVRDQLREELLGLYITKIEYTDYFVKNKKFIDKKLVKSHLPLLLTEVTSRGKRVIFIHTNKDDEETAFVWFFCMTGRLSFIEGKHDQMIFTFSRKRSNGGFEEKKTLRYSDKRPLGWLKYITTVEELHHIFKDVGLQYIPEEVTLDIFTEGIKRPNFKDK
jgi:formamidopyrimidine-DNA glycosylase